MADEPLKLLFVCTGNSCRSQMAEGFARHYGKEKIEVKSAGTAATGFVSEDTIEAMHEAGIDISFHTSKQLTDEMIRWADIVVTLGRRRAKEICPPDFRGKKYDWSIEDPLGKPRGVLQRVRDEIETKVKELLKENVEG